MSTEQTKEQNRRAGRTLLVKPNSESFDSSIFDSLTGMVNNHESERTSTYFLTFDTLECLLPPVTDPGYRASIFISLPFFKLVAT